MKISSLRMDVKRNIYREYSNNPKNPNKNICGQAVAAAFGRSDKGVRFLHTSFDVIRAVKKNNFICSKQKTIKGKQIKDIDFSENDGVVGHIVEVQGHILAISGDGKSFIDTDPITGDTDNREIKNHWLVL